MAYKPHTPDSSCETTKTASTNGLCFRTILARMLEPARSTAMPLTPRIRLAAWWRACRPPFFIVDLIPVGLGLFLALRTDNGIPAPDQWTAALWGRLGLVLFGCFCVHTIANIANDLFDHILGVDSDETIGGSRVIQEGSISPRQITVALGMLTLGGVVSAVALMQLSGQWWLVWPLLFALFSAVFYVAPPIRYGHRGYGELFVGLNMGFIMVSGTQVVLADQFSIAALGQGLALGLPVGLMVAGILFYQSLPEIETDRAAGKFTLAVHMGKVRSELLFRLWWPTVWVLMLNLWAVGLLHWPVVLGLGTLPLYLRVCELIRQADNWLDLDAHGHLVRKLYLLNGIALLAGCYGSSGCVPTA